MTIAGGGAPPTRPILVLEGVDDRAAAEALRGRGDHGAAGALGTLAEGEYLVDDLVGCEVVDGERPVGRVRDVLLLPSADTLEVGAAGRRAAARAAGGRRRAQRRHRRRGGSTSTSSFLVRRR